jgi:hypothetical protein
MECAIELSKMVKKGVHIKCFQNKIFKVAKK